MNRRIPRCAFHCKSQRVVRPHASRHLEGSDQDKDQRNPNQSEFKKGSASRKTSAVVAHIYFTIIWTVRVIVNCPARPGIGINVLVVYVTDTEDAGDPSAPVTELAATIRGLELQLVRLRTLLIVFNSVKAYLQAPAESAAFEDALDV